MASVIPRAIPATSGLPLSELLAGHRGRIPLAVGLGIVREVAQLLERAHSAGHVHGALSAHAVWLSMSGEVWLEWHPRRSPVARSLPPEVRAGETPTSAADVYALAALGYELLTGLSISRAWAKAPLVHLQDVASPRQFNSQVPPVVDELISLSLARHPADRPARIETLARTVELALPSGWEASLAAMISDSFFGPAVRDLPVTCERAGAALPPLRVLEPRPVLVPPFVANDDQEPLRSAMPMVKIMVVTALAAALSLAFCLGLSRLGSSEGGTAALASRALVNAPVVVAAVAPARAEAPARVVELEKPPKKVKAERSRAVKRSVTKRKK